MITIPIVPIVIVCCILYNRQLIYLEDTEFRQDCRRIIPKRKKQILGILENGLSYLGESIAEENSCNLRISTGQGNILYERNFIDESEPGDNFGKLIYTVEILTFRKTEKA